jgi:putative transposase
LLFILVYFWNSLFLLNLPSTREVAPYLRTFAFAPILLTPRNKPAALKGRRYNALVKFARKRIRLPVDAYRGLKRCFLTFCCENRHAPFTQPDVAEWIIGRLREIAATNLFAVPAWCAMPDHLHALIEARDDTCDILEFAARFKQRTAYEGKRLWAQTLWQPRYYDHLLRHEEELGRIARYIWANPIRKGICAKVEDYPYSGSDIPNWLQAYRGEPEWTPDWKLSS